MSRRRKGLGDSLYYYKWLDKALIDLQAARILHTWNGHPTMVAFHCQQALEKVLKGYLLFKTGSHFDGHNLTYLCRQAARIDERFAEHIEQTTDLNNLYVETRYPTDLPFSLTDAQISRLLGVSERLFSMIRAELYQAGPPHKIRTGAAGGETVR